MPSISGNSDEGFSPPHELWFKHRWYHLVALILDIRDVSTYSKESNMLFKQLGTCPLGTVLLDIWQ